MQRHTHEPRPDWQSKVEDLGLSFHTIDDEPYWDESAHYELTAQEVAVLESSAAELQKLCVEAAEIAIRDDWRGRLHIPEAAWREILASWERDDLSLYGRFDFLWDGSGAPKLLEYNADTPTGLLEASVVQWHWLEECFPNRDQFNSIHEQLLASWPAWKEDWVSFTALSGPEEDWRTLLYLEDTCRQSGKSTINFALEDMGWDAGRKVFVGPGKGIMSRVFKLYPWEWMWGEEFGQYLPGRCEIFLEPVWKMLWSNKAFLVLLWESFPGHPCLLPAAFDSSSLGSSYVEKPIFGREGANVRLVRHGQEVATADGPWGEQVRIFQECGPDISYDGNYPVLGSWIVGGAPAGLGIREEKNRITTNASRFVPHLF